MKNIFVFLSLLVIISCNDKNSFDSYQNDKTGSIQIDLADIPYESKYILDSIVSIEKIVKLESSDQSFIGSYDKILIDDNKIFIMDKKSTHSIFAFTLDGNFVYKISNYGEGPEEYLELRDFTVSPSSTTLDILDFGGRKILSYDKNTGEIVSKSSIDRNTNFAALEKNKNKYFVAHSNRCGFLVDCFNISFYDEKLSLISSSLEIHDKFKDYDYKGNANFSRNGDRLYFTELFNDTIYEVVSDKNALRVAFVINFGKYKLPDDFKYSAKNSSLSDVIIHTRNNNYTLGVHDYFIADKVLYFRYGLPDLREVYINLTTKNSISFSKFSTQNLFLLGEIKAVHNGIFLKLTPAETIVSLVKNNFNTKDSVQIRGMYWDFYNLVKDMNEGSNGIITFVKPKI